MDIVYFYRLKKDNNEYSISVNRKSSIKVVLTKMVKIYLAILPSNTYKSIQEQLG